MSPGPSTSNHRSSSTVELNSGCQCEAQGNGDQDEMKMKSSSPSPSSSSSMKSRNHSRLVLKHAIASRLLLLSLILLWRSLLSPYDTSASINPACVSSSSDSPNSNPQVLFPRVAAALEDSIVWDSVYFVRIAQCGYEYEQSYAFFPLLPICISLLSRTG